MLSRRKTQRNARNRPHNSSATRHFYRRRGGRESLALRLGAVAAAHTRARHDMGGEGARESTAAPRPTRTAPLGQHTHNTSAWQPWGDMGVLGGPLYFKLGWSTGVRTELPRKAWPCRGAGSPG